MLAAGTSGNLVVTAQAVDFTPSGTVYASASDAAGVLQAPVQVAAGANGRYTFSLDTASGAPPGHYQGYATVKLCGDQACTTVQPVTPLSVPYDITILKADAAWPGDNLTALVPAPGAGDWSTYGGNNAHTGYVPVEIEPDKITLRWKRNLVTSPWSVGSNSPAPLINADGLLYASEAKTLTAYNESDGSRAWQTALSALISYVTNSPTVSNGVVYATGMSSNTSYLYGFDSATGVQRFSGGSVPNGYLFSPIIEDGVIYANGSKGLYGFSSTGRLLFQANAVDSEQPAGAPAADANGVYMNTTVSITAFKPKTGELLAHVRDNGTSFVYNLLSLPPVIGPNGVYALAVHSDRAGIALPLVQFDMAKGVAGWRADGSYGQMAYANGVLYAGQNKPVVALEARAETDGKLLWSWTPPLSTATSSIGTPVLTKNLLFVGSGSTTYAIDLASRKTVWSFPMAGGLSISKNGVLYIQGTESTVAINLK